MRITVRVAPGSARPRVGGRYGDALLVAVSPPAVEGRATAACLAAVAAAFGVPDRRVRLVTGARSRNKILDIDVDEETGASDLQRLLAAGG